MRYVVWVLSEVLAFILQGFVSPMGGLWGVQPDVVMVVAIALAMCAGPLCGGVCGSVMGILCDCLLYTSRCV